MTTEKTRLSEAVLEKLVPISEYTQFLFNIFGDSSDDYIAEKLSKNIPLQHATIFCLKAISCCVEQASEFLVEKGVQLPKFWLNFKYLRNALIHHVLSFELNPEAIKALSTVISQVADMYYYFLAVRKEGVIEVDVKREGLKEKIYQLTEMLKKSLPREQRDATRLKQCKDLARTLIEAISQCKKYSEVELKKIKSEAASQVDYYSLQNYLEFFATVTNPNTDFDNAAVAFRDWLENLHVNAKDWLGLLGQDRIEAVHQNGFMLDKAVVENVRHISTLHQGLQAQNYAVHLKEIEALRRAAELKICKFKPAHVSQSILVEAQKNTMQNIF